MKTSKPWYTSRTIWANIIAVLLVVLVQLQAVPGIPQAWIPYMAVGIGAINMILRIITTQALALTAGQPEPIPPPKGVSFDTGPGVAGQKSTIVPAGGDWPATPTPSAVPGEHNYITADDLSGIPPLPGKEGPHDGC